MAPSCPIGSVVTPAPEAVIRCCLDAMLCGFAPGEFNVASAYNRCTNRTADVFHARWRGVRVIEVAQAFRSAGLQRALGEVGKK
jgi:hypothetical protein